MKYKFAENSITKGNQECNFALLKKGKNHNDIL